MLGWNAITLLAASALAPAPPPPPPADLPTPAQVMQLPDALKDRLQREVVARSTGREDRLQRLVDFTFRPDGLGLQYDPDITLTAAQAYAQRKVNCLSFSLLFVAMARQIGLDARVQEVGQVASWYESRGLVYNAGHVNVGLRVNTAFATLDLDSNVLYDRRGPRAISDARAMAHFYNNLGVERMAAGNIDNAGRYFQAALSQDPRFVSTWNNLGVLAMRQGQAAQADRAYQAALALKPDHAATLTNAVVLAEQTGNTTRARQLQARLQRRQQRDPFFHFLQGGQAERDGRMDDAVTHYKRAVALYGAAHQFHFGLARAYFLSGQSQRAEREMAKARDLANTDSGRLRYQAKLDSLRRLEQRTARRH